MEVKDIRKCGVCLGSVMFNHVPNRPLYPLTSPLQGRYLFHLNTRLAYSDAAWFGSRWRRWRYQIHIRIRTVMRSRKKASSMNYLLPANTTSTTTTYQVVVVFYDEDGTFISKGNEMLETFLSVHFWVDGERKIFSFEWEKVFPEASKNFLSEIFSFDTVMNNCSADRPQEYFASRMTKAEYPWQWQLKDVRKTFRRDNNISFYTIFLPGQVFSRQEERDEKIWQILKRRNYFFLGKILVCLSLRQGKIWCKKKESFKSSLRKKETKLKTENFTSVIHKLLL